MHPRLRVFQAILSAALLAPAALSCTSAERDSVAPAAWVSYAEWAVPAVDRPGPTAPARAAPAIVFESLRGAEPGRVRAAFAPLRRALRECRHGTTGVIVLELTTAAAHVHMGVKPPTTLDPRERRCVLETLSTVDIEGISGDASPSARPSGFSALLRIEF